jgi:hypothetical protein
MCRLAGLCALWLLCGCAAEPDDELPFHPNPPIDPGGSDGGTVDAGSDAGVDAITTIAGRVCVLDDLRSWSGCASTGAAGLTVSLDGNTATTAADGSFTIVRSSDPGRYAIASGTVVATSAVRFDPLATALQIPAPRRTYWDTVLTLGGAQVPSGTGSIAVQVMRNGSPVVGVSATSVPGPSNLVLYDSSSATAWDTDSTSTAGVALLTGIVAEPATVSLNAPATPAVGAATAVMEETLTFLTVTLP